MYFNVCLLVLYTYCVYVPAPLSFLSSCPLVISIFLSSCHFYLVCLSFLYKWAEWTRGQKWYTDKKIEMTTVQENRWWQRDKGTRWHRDKRTEMTKEQEDKKYYKKGKKTKVQRRKDARRKEQKKETMKRSLYFFSILFLFFLILSLFISVHLCVHSISI